VRDLLLDFESFFGSIKLPLEPGQKRAKTFNLSLKNPKLSYTDYVRHPEFEVLGVSVRWRDEPEKSTKFIRGPEVRKFLEAIDWRTTRVIAHNAVFDGLILQDVYGIVPLRYFCTMAWAEAIFQGAVGRGLGDIGKFLGLGEKSPDLANFRGLHICDIDEPGWDTLGKYANNDVNLMGRVLDMLEDQLPADEAELMSYTLMLFCDPVMEIDVELAEEALAEAIAERDKCIAATGLDKQEISGNISFEKHLRAALGGWIPTKLNKKQKVKPAFAKDDLEFVMLKTHPDEKVRNLVLARMEVKSGMGINRAERLIKMGRYREGLMYVCLHYARAHTMRWTGGNKMNPQNFMQGSKMRRSLRAPKGHVLVVADSSQIEDRWNCALAGQEDVLDIYRAGGDPYAYQASAVYGFEVTKETHPDERFMGKTCRLALGFGMGWWKFYVGLRTGARGKAIDITTDFAQSAVQIYRHTNDKIMDFHDEVERWLWYLANDENPIRAERDGLITLDPATKRIIFPNGCWLRYPGLLGDADGLRYRSWGGSRYIWKYIYGGLADENLTQALARHTVAWQVLQLARKFKPVLLVHDEGVFCVKREAADDVLGYALEMFRKSPPWLDMIDVPLDSEGGYDVSYSK